MPFDEADARVPQRGVKPVRITRFPREEACGQFARVASCSSRSGASIYTRGWSSRARAPTACASTATTRPRTHLGPRLRDCEVRGGALGGDDLRRRAPRVNSYLLRLLSAWTSGRAGEERGKKKESAEDRQRARCDDRACATLACVAAPAAAAGSVDSFRPGEMRHTLAGRSRTRDHVLPSRRRRLPGLTSPRPGVCTYTRFFLPRRRAVRKRAASCIFVSLFSRRNYVAYL